MVILLEFAPWIIVSVGGGMGRRFKAVGSQGKEG